MTDAGFWAALDKLADVCEIKIDRPKGSRHPNWPDLVYPLDYGFLEGTKSGDGNEIDVWAGSLSRSSFRRLRSSLTCTSETARSSC